MRKVLDLPQNKATALRILGLNQGGSQLKVKKAYRELAVKHHPDKGGRTEEFVKIKMAYDYLVEHGTIIKKDVSIHDIFRERRAGMNTATQAAMRQAEANQRQAAQTAQMYRVVFDIGFGTSFFGGNKKRT